MIEELIVIAAFFIGGFIVGWKYREYVAIKNIDSVMRDAEKISVIDIKIEKVDGQLFVYNRLTSEYMAHSNTRWGLENLLRQKYPGKTFNTSSEDIQKLNEPL